MDKQVTSNPPPPQYLETNNWENMRSEATLVGHGTRQVYPVSPPKNFIIWPRTKDSDQTGGWTG